MFKLSFKLRNEVELAILCLTYRAQNNIRIVACSHVDQPDADTDTDYRFVGT